MTVRKILNYISGYRQEVEFSCVKVVYKSKNGSWRGFIDPYDITIEADSCTQASDALDDMLETYIEISDTYNRPSHLMDKTLSDEEDRAKFGELQDTNVLRSGITKTKDLYVETKVLQAA